MTKAAPTVTTAERPATSSKAPASIPAPPPQKSSPRPQRAEASALVSPARIMPIARALKCSPATV